ncbi:MAG: hypothetical protein QOI61_1066, partial [Actinomycetota bacterium]
MSRRLAIGVVVMALLGGACGLGEKQAQADRIIDAGKHLMNSSVIGATISAQVRVLPVERVLAIQEPPRIAPGALPPIDAVLAPRADAAAVAGVLLFADDVIYERIAPKRAAASAASALGVQSNLAAIVAAATGAVLTAPTPLPSEAAPTTTTTAPRALRRTVQIVREWAAFDFSEIPDDDRTKHGGSFAINPVTLLRLTTGVLTGSIEP